jgi:serine/threonine protein kinase
VETAAELFIMMEYAEGGSLWDMLSRTEDLPFAWRMEVALDAARGLHYLHTNKPAVLHRDIKGCAPRIAARPVDAHSV